MGGILPSILVLLFFYQAADAASDNLDVQPAEVTISSFFSGVQMRITAELPPGSQAVLRILGKRIEEELMRKTHHWELWMNSGEVDIENAPVLYIVLSSAPDLLPPDGGDNPWGYHALEQEARFSGRLKSSEDEKIFSEFVQLKERDNLYHLYPGGLKITSLDPNRSQVSASIHLPSRLKPGTYRITLWIIRDGQANERRDGTFDVRRQGLPELLHALAADHGVLYGIFAVIIAMAVGLLTGLAFHRTGRGH